MYKLPQDEDWTFLHGKTVEQVCIGKYDVQLRFNGDVTISIRGDDSASSFRHSTTAATSPGVGDFPSTAAGLSSLVGASISRALVEDELTLLLVFDNGEELRIFDSSEHYESFTITSPDGTIVV